MSGLVILSTELVEVSKDGRSDFQPGIGNELLCSEDFFVTPEFIRGFFIMNLPDQHKPRPQVGIGGVFNFHNILCFFKCRTNIPVLQQIPVK